ncbi:MAG: translation initiation factor IF-3 [Clostridia bacterium]|nr:translation initiation factor IF-3 [Clostridia bacterium]
MATKETLINENIRCKEVRVINQDGQQLGIMAPESALRIAYNSGLDLILISPNAQPPVCRIADYGRYRFEQDKREKEAKKKQNIIEVKEVQLSCRIETHDFETKVNHALRFLGDGNKVKVVLRFRGREMSHQQLGKDILDQFKEAVKESGTVEKAPVLDGKLMTMIVSPIARKDSSKKDKNQTAEVKTEEVTSES